MHPSQTITAELFRVAREHPDRVAVFAPHGPASLGLDRYQATTFGELVDDVHVLRRGLLAAGITAGMRAAVLVPPGPALSALTFALFEVGVVPVLVDPGIGLRQVKACLGQARPEIFIGTTKAQLAQWLLGWAKDSVRFHVSVGGPWHRGLSLDDLRRLRSSSASSRPAAVLDSSSDVAAIVFTSGSTGPAKGVVYRHRHFFGMWKALKEVVVDPACRFDVPTFPLFALFDPALGLTTVLPAMDFTRPALVDPLEIIGPIDLFGVEMMFGSPALLNTVGRYAEAHPGLPVLSSLKTVVSAGAPVPGDVIRRFRRLLPTDARVLTPYGATECLPVAILDDSVILGETSAMTDRGLGVCVGPEAPGVRVRVIAITDAPLPRLSDGTIITGTGPSSIGEFIVGGDRVTDRYLVADDGTDHNPGAKIVDDSDEDSAVIHRLGDVGYRDDAGRLWYCGRKSHRVQLADRLLFTEMVEGVFNTHPEVRRTALVGVDVDGVVTPVLCVELERGVPRHRSEGVRQELLTMARARADTAVIETVLFHPAFPTDIRHNSKIFRERLRVWAAARR
jgi:acyl-CoA synthetase (AMP-forming)/AMP-acid ligase II